MVRVGLIGVGFMGWIHWLAYQRADGIRVAAIASRDAAKRAGDWRGIQGNFGPPGEQVDLSGVRVYADWIELIDDPEIDCVDICLPPNQHAEVAQAAARAGKHVFCEKPVALNSADAASMQAACERNDVQLLVGHVLPFFREYAWARQQIDSGAYGAVRGGHFKRIISNPEWILDFFDLERVGGPLVDLHIHDAHWIRLLFGMPTGLFCAGYFHADHRQTIEFATSVFQFDDPTLVVSSSTGVIRQPGRPFTHGFEIYLERATMQFEFAALANGSETMPIKLISESRTVDYPPAKDFDPVDAFVAEVQEVQSAIRSNSPSKVLSGSLAADALKICEFEAISATRRAYVELK